MKRHQDRLGIEAGYLPRRPGQDGAGAPCLRLDEVARLSQLGQHGTKGPDQVLSCQNPEALVGHQSPSPVHGIDDERALAGQREELFGSGPGAHGPEPGTDAAGKDQDPQVCVSVQRGSP